MKTRQWEVLGASPAVARALSLGRVRAQRAGLAAEFQKGLRPFGAHDNKIIHWCPAFEGQDHIIDRAKVVDKEGCAGIEAICPGPSGDNFWLALVALGLAKISEKKNGWIKIQYRSLSTELSRSNWERMKQAALGRSHSRGSGG